MSVQEAKTLLAQWLRPTRLLRSEKLSTRFGRNVYLKLESEQPTGSFKVRGALYALWHRMQDGAVREVVASSTGNHGAAVAYAAQKLGVPAKIFLPAEHNQRKRAIIESLGATVVVGGRDISEGFDAAVAYADRHGAYALNDSTDEHLPHGPATIALEIDEQARDIGWIFVPVGDTALLRGIAAGLRDVGSQAKIIGVQAKNAPAYSLSWRAGKVVTTDTCDTIADGLATRIPLASSVQSIRESAAEMRLVTDEEMLSAVRQLSIDENVIAEPSGAASLAALLQSPPPGAGGVVLLITGSNVTDDVRRRAGIL